MTTTAQERREDWAKSRLLTAYAEALRTGRGDAHGLRRRVLSEQAANENTLAALEAEMPHSAVGKPREGRRRQQARKAAPHSTARKLRGSNEPTGRQSEELARLCKALGRPTPQPPTRQAAGFEIDRLRQVLWTVTRS